MCRKFKLFGAIKLLREIKMFEDGRMMVNQSSLEVGRRILCILVRKRKKERIDTTLLTFFSSPFLSLQLLLHHQHLRDTHLLLMQHPRSSSTSLEEETRHHQVLTRYQTSLTHVFRSSVILSSTRRQQRPVRLLSLETRNTFSRMDSPSLSASNVQLSQDSWLDLQRARLMNLLFVTMLRLILLSLGLTPTASSFFSLLFSDFSLLLDPSLETLTFKFWSYEKKLKGWNLNSCRNINCIF